MKILDVPFAFSSNGDGYIKKNMITKEEVEIGLDEFPSPEEMGKEYITCSGISEEQQKLIDEYGNLITENFTQYVKNKITDEFSTYSLFKQYWDSEEMKMNIYSLEV